MDDWQLLHDFAARGDQKAFETLVRRHAGLVHSVALRHVGDSQLAEDIAQAVFTLLARKADTLRQGQIVLAGWLFQTTRFVAQRAYRGEERRRRREEVAVAMKEEFTPEVGWDQVGPLVDEALERLNHADRDALLLRFFEGYSMREVGAQIGASEEAAKKRVARALEKVRAVLLEHGFSLSAAGLGCCMQQQAKAALGTEQVERLAAAALSSAVGHGTAIRLVQETAASWRWARFKTAALLTGTIAFLGIVSFWSLQPGPPEPAANSESPSPTQIMFVPPPQQIRPTASPMARPGGNVLRFRAVDGPSGAGVAGARIAHAIWVNNTVEDHVDRVTDVSGSCVIAYPPGTGRLDVGVVQDGYEARFATWPFQGSAEIPAEYTLRLERVTNSIGGQILGEQDQPLADAVIWFQAGGTGDSAHRERPRERFGFLNAFAATRTDAEGRWSINFVPTRHPGFTLRARHPDFADTLMTACAAQDAVDQTSSPEVQALWQGTFVSRMNPAFTLTGTVQDSSGQPIVGAKIQERAQEEAFFTDASGNFRIPKLAAGPRSFTVTAEGFAPERTTTEVAPGMEPVRVILQAGALLRLRLVDEADRAVPHATIVLEQWGEHRQALDWRTNADAEGHLEWHSAPRDAQLELVAFKAGFAYSRGVRVVANGQEHLIRMNHVLEVEGHVVDANSGLEVQQFKAVPGYGGYGNRSERWFASSTVLGTHGHFNLAFDEGSEPFQVRIIADGFEDWISDPLGPESPVALEVTLKRALPNNAVRGVVMKPDGAPAGRAQVALLSFEHSVRLTSGLRLEGNQRWLTQTDDNGVFQFPANSMAHSVAAVSSNGYAQVRISRTGQAVSLQLQPYGRIEGVVDTGAMRHPVETLYLYDPTADQYEGAVKLLGSYTAALNSEGRFCFSNVPPGEFSVFINSGQGIPFHHQTPLIVKPNANTQVVIAEPAGTRVRGQLLPSAAGAISWRKELVTAQIYLEPSRSPLPRGSEAERPWRELEFWTSPAGRQYVNTPRVYSVWLEDDGSFESIEPLPLVHTASESSSNRPAPAAHS